MEPEQAQALVQVPAGAPVQSQVPERGLRMVQGPAVRRDQPQPHLKLSAECLSDNGIITQPAAQTGAHL